MVIISVTQDEEEDETKDNTCSSSKKFREAKEAFVFMKSDVRVSRDIRAQWFFKHLNQLIEVKPDFKMVRKILKMTML